MNPDQPYDCCRPALTWCTAPSKPPPKCHRFWQHRVRGWRVRLRRRFRPFTKFQYPNIKTPFPPINVAELVATQPMTGVDFVGILDRLENHDLVIRMKPEQP